MRMEQAEASSLLVSCIHISLVEVVLLQKTTDLVPLFLLLLASQMRLRLLKCALFLQLHSLVGLCYHNITFQKAYRLARDELAAAPDILKTLRRNEHAAAPGEKALSERRDHERRLQFSTWSESAVNEGFNSLETLTSTINYPILWAVSGCGCQALSTRSMALFDGRCSPHLVST